MYMGDFTQPPSTDEKWNNVATVIFNHVNNLSDFFTLNPFQPPLTKANNVLNFA